MVQTGTFEMVLKLMVIIFVLINEIVSQASSANNCTKIFRQVQRSGPTLQGRLEVPIDKDFPKFQMRLKFNRAVAYVTVRNLKAKNMGMHKEFAIDPMEQTRDGIFHLNTYIRLRSFMGATPKLTRVVYNNRVLCGDPLTQSEIDEAIVVELPTTTTVVPILRPTTTTQQPKQKDKDDDEEDSDITT